MWRAWDLRRGDWCAAKVMRQRDGGDLLRFAREQGLRLEHPHLLTPYSWAAEDAHVVLASRLVGGGSLHTLLGDHGPLAPALVADLLDQLLDGLAHVHATGVVHRDVTPSNVLLEATGSGRPVARLADFGLAVRVGEPRLTRLGTVLGTAGYVPPEVLGGAAPHPAADLYAAGRLAEALLTGTEPDPTTDPAPMTPRPGGAGRAAGDVAERLWAVVVALTAADPGDRPAAAEARRLLAAEPVPGPRTVDGDPVTVLSQLPPLPPDWTTPAPPRPAPEPAAPPAARTGPVLPAAARTGPVVPTAGRTQPFTTSTPGPGGRSAPTDPHPTGPTPGSGGAPDPTGQGAGRRMRRRGWVGVGGAAALVAAGVVAVLVATGNGAGPGGGGDGSPTPSPSGVPVSTGPATAGGTCGWQQEGDGADDPTGRPLLCVRTAAGFRWQPA